MKMSTFLKENDIGDAVRPILLYFVKWRFQFSFGKLALEMPFVRYCCILWNENVNLPWENGIGDAVRPMLLDFVKWKWQFSWWQITSEMSFVRYSCVLWNEKVNFPDGKCHWRCRSPDTVPFREMKTSIFLEENVIGEAVWSSCESIVWLWRNCHWCREYTTRPRGPHVTAMR